MSEVTITLNTNIIMKKIKDFANKHPEGFTIDPVTLKTPESGYAVAMLETQGSFGSDGLKKALEKAIENGDFLGGWLDTESGLFYYDWVKVIDDRAEAMKAGRENLQIAIFDLSTGTEIRL